MLRCHCLWIISIAICLLLISIITPAIAEDPVDIGNQLELFVDDHLIAEMTGGVDCKLLKPVAKEVVFEADQPWEGNTSGYYSLFRDGDIYRMIYRGWQHDANKKAVHKEVTCYAESKDGIHWTKPNLGLFDWNGSKENNIIWMGPGSHNFTAFRDDNPDAPNESRYKAFGGGSGGLLAFQSPDCIHWKLIQSRPVITNGAFDSQNLAFWDADCGEYRAYWRYFTKGITTQNRWQPAGFRAIRTATSKDFINWENEADLTYTAGTPTEHLYTNAIQKYFRAPHLFVGFPTRYLPSQGQRVEPLLMASRNGVHFNRWPEAVITEDAPADRKGNRSNYMTWGMFQLPSNLKEISVYATENYYEPTPGRVRRFVYRVDGFVALRGGDQGGTMTTKLLRHKGKKLLLNYKVGENGFLKVEVIDETGDLIGKSVSLRGDAVDSLVQWAQDPRFNGSAVRLRFTLKNADLYSLRFD